MKGARVAKRSVLIISPASAKANNGNWQTAQRWQRLLQVCYRTEIAREWDGSPCDVMIALHARRSAAAIQAYSRAWPARPLVLVLTGTDLYRDIVSDADAQRSLQLATHLIVLQEAGLQQLAPPLRAKARVIYQSAPVLQAVPPPSRPRHFDLIMIGHLRAEKDPQIFMNAAIALSTRQSRIALRFTHVGAALDPELQVRAEQTQASAPCYRWLGNLPHAKTRQLLKRSDLMVLSSRMEGGANVIIEAVNSGVPVLASDIAGNRGMLGEDYAGYFPPGDMEALVRLIERAANDRDFLAQLRRQCAARMPLFAPERERASLLALLDELMDGRAESDSLRATDMSTHAKP